MLSVILPKLEISDLGDEFNLENFPFSENADSDKSQGSSRAISETTISFVEAFALSRSELRLMEKEITLPLVRSGAVDSQIKVDTGNLSVGDVSLLASTLGMMLGRNMMNRRWGHESSSHLLPSYPLLGQGQTTAMSELLHPGKCLDKSLKTAMRNKCMSPCSMAGSWPRKELDLECKLELAFHTDFYAKSHGVQIVQVSGSTKKLHYCRT